MYPKTVAIVPSLKSLGLFISTGSIAGRTAAEVARYDRIVTNYDKTAYVLAAKALNPDLTALSYKNALLCNDWGREGPPPLPTDGHGVGTTGVSHTELVENPGWGLYEMLTEVYTDSVLRDLDPPFGPTIQNAFWTLDGAAGGPQVSIAPMGTYTADLSAAGITLDQASICGNASLNSIDFTTNGIGTTFPISNAAQYTFEGWARLDALPPGGQYRTLVGSDGATHRMILAIRSDGFPSFWTDSALDAQTWFNEALVAGEDFHWAMTWDYTTLEAEFFKNGESFGTVTLGQGMTSPGNLVIGAWHSDKAHDVWDGKLSLVSVHPRILSEGRLTAHYINGPTVTPGGGDLCESGLFPDNYLGNVGHSGYIQRWIDNIRLDLDTQNPNVWDGIMMDDVDDTARFHFGVWIGLPGDPYTPMVDDDLRELFDVFLSAVYADMKNDYLLWANLANSGRPDIHDRWAPWLHGALREFWKKTGTGTSQGGALEPPAYPAALNERYVGLEYPYEDGYFPVWNEHAKGFCPITYGVVSDTVAQLYGYASALVQYDASWDQYYCFAKGDAVEDSWTAYWTTDIGQPVSDRIEVDTYCYTREFTDGFVMVNGSESTKVFDSSEWSQAGFTLLSTGLQAGATVSLAAGRAEIIIGRITVPDNISRVTLPRKHHTAHCRPEVVLES